MQIDYDKLKAVIDRTPYSVNDLSMLTSIPVDRLFQFIDNNWTDVPKPEADVIMRAAVPKKRTKKRGPRSDRNIEGEKEVIRIAKLLWEFQARHLCSHLPRLTHTFIYACIRRLAQQGRIQVIDAGDARGNYKTYRWVK